MNLVLHNTGSYKPYSTDGRKMERKRAGRVEERDILNRVLSADRWTMERTRERGGRDRESCTGEEYSQYGHLKTTVY